MDCPGSSSSGVASVRFLDEGADGPTGFVPVTGELAALFARAAQLNSATGAPFHLSFDSLFAAFTQVDDLVSAWVTQFAEITRVVLTAGVSHLPANLRLDGKPPLDLLDFPLTRTVSARRAIERALELKKRARGGDEGSPLDAVHLLGALLWLDGHDRDFATMRLAPHVWRPAFCQAAARFRPEEESYWLALRESATRDALLGDGASSSATTSSATTSSATTSSATTSGARGRVPVSYLATLQFSSMARQLVDQSIHLAGHEALSSVLSTRSLLSAILDGGLPKAGSSLEWLSAALGRDAVRRWPQVRAKYYARRSTTVGSLEVTQLTEDYGQVLQRAGELAAATTGSREIHARHLIAALLVYSPPDPSNAQKLLIELGCDPAALRPALLGSLLAWGRDDANAWRRALSPSDGVEPQPEEPSPGESKSEAPKAEDPKPEDLTKIRPSWGLPRISNDCVRGFIPPDRDFLDASRPALRFAKLLSAREVKPPIALGLFGNWGSGKTFFMGLMQSHVKTLTEGSDTDYVRRAAQIEFNAWHYQDTNLWASIAVRVFDGLVRELAPRPPSPSKIEDTRRILNQQIASSKDRKAEADAQRQQALASRAKKSVELDDMIAKRQRRADEAERLQLAAAWDVLKKDERVLQVAENLKEWAGELGLSDEVKTAGDLGQLKNDLQHLSTRGQTLVAAVSARFERGRLFFTCAWLIALIAGVSTIGWLVESLPSWLPHRAGDPVPTLPGASMLAQATAFVSAAAAWISDRLRKASRAVDEATRLDARIQSKASELGAEERAAKERAAKEGAAKEGAGKELAQKETPPEDDLASQIATLDRRILGATEDLREADRQIAEATAEVERINQGGLVYDFLQERRTSTKYADQLGLVSTIRRDFDELGQLLSEWGSAGSKPIERIILYVDDLDRCQPSKVVEVLQAVHLLLAFDIFHVVVGVDARWLRRSLEETYASEKAGPIGEFSAHDYLEKIFQIPYALAPLQEKGFHDLIDGMIQTRTEWTAVQEKTRAKPHVAAPPPPPASVDPAGAHGGIAPAEKPSGIKPGSTPPPPSVPPPSTSAASVVFFEDHEEKFIKELHEFINRPRLAGRFVNIYRLLRARAADEQEDQVFAASSESIDYRVALLLLAINVGHPRLAGHVFHDLSHAKERSWREFVSAQRARADLSNDSRKAYGQLLDAIDRLSVEMPEDLGDYTRWVQRVACFSFELPGALLPTNPPTAPSLSQAPGMGTAPWPASVG